MPPPLILPQPLADFLTYSMQKVHCFVPGETTEEMMRQGNVNMVRDGIRPDKWQMTNGTCWLLCRSHYLSSCVTQ